MKFKGIKKLFFMSMVLFLALSLILSGCGSKPAEGDKDEDTAADDNVIKIGVYEPMTGASAAGGQMTVEGIELAKEMYPEVLGKEVKLIIVDNKTEKTESANAVARLIEKDKVSVIIGSYGSSNAMAGGQVAKEKEVPVVGCSPTNPLVTLDNDYYFRVCFIDPFQGKVMAKFAYNTLGAKKAAIIFFLN